MDVLHGDRVPDPFRWLENASSADVRRWVDAQDAYTDAYLGAVPGGERFAKRMRALVSVDELRAPQHGGHRYVFAKKEAAQDRREIYVQQEGAQPSVLFDTTFWPEGEQASVKQFWLSPDGQTIVCKVSKNNADESKLYVVDIATRALSHVDVIPGVRDGEVSWKPDSSGFVYNWLPSTADIKEADLYKYCEIRFHSLGADPKSDAVVRPRTDDVDIFETASFSSDGHWLIVTADHGWSQNHVWYRDERLKGSPWVPLAVGKDARYTVRSYRDQFYVHTTENAPRGRVLRVDPRNAVREAWVELIPEQTDSTLRTLEIIGGELAIAWVRDVTVHLELRDLHGRTPREIALPAVGTAYGPYGSPSKEEGFFRFMSYTVAPEVHSFSVRSGDSRVWQRPSLPYDSKKFVTEQVFYTSKDGTRVPMFIVRRRDLVRTGNNPTMVLGYGGFRQIFSPDYYPSVIAWLEDGGIYVEPSLRGGGEYGEEWHRAGMLTRKQNTFDDFIAAAEELVRLGWTRPELLVARGESNGGLLVTAVLTQRPELFRAVVATVPITDMLRFHLVGQGSSFVSEYGTPDSAEHFAVLRAYSPYHNVREGTKYPAVLVLMSDSDDRVDGMHARKFVAALQAATKGGPVLLRVRKNAGHEGSSSTAAMVNEEVDVHSFVSASLRP